MKIISLNQNKVALVDNEDYERLIQFSWFYTTGYAAHSGRNFGARKSSVVFMTSEILRTNKLIDHKDHNKLNNQKHNLRICTNSQNQQNQVKTKNKTSSKYKGVCFNKRNKKWQANIRLQDCLKQKNSTHLGLYLEEENAARAYDDAARYYFGEFASLNFPEEGEISCL